MCTCPKAGIGLQHIAVRWTRRVEKAAAWQSSYICALVRRTCEHHKLRSGFLWLGLGFVDSSVSWRQNSIRPYCWRPCGGQAFSPMSTHLLTKASLREVGSSRASCETARHFRKNGIVSSFSLALAIFAASGVGLGCRAGAMLPFGRTCGPMLTQLSISILELCAGLCSQQNYLRLVSGSKIMLAPASPVGRVARAEQV